MISRLEAAGLALRLGGLRVLDGVSIAIRSDEVVGIVGPNGAGKTTLLAVLSGAYRPSAGRIELDGRDISKLPASERCKVGVVRTYQIPKPFAGLRVIENILVAATSTARERGVAYDLALDAIERCGMLPRANRPAESLGLLDRKRLELARALATRPRLLLLDEIGGGLTDAEASELVDTIRDLHESGIGIVWIEHIVHVLLQVAGRLICMDAGRIIADGDPEVVMRDPGVMRAYLGAVV